MDTKEPCAGSVQGIVHTSGGMGDFLLEREFARHAHGLEPLVSLLRQWSVEANAAELEAARGRLVEEFAPRGLVLRSLLLWEEGWEALFADGRGALLHTRVDHDDYYACGYGTSRELCDELLAAYSHAMRPVAPGARRGALVPVRFWRLGSDGATSFVRRVRCPRWSEVAANYPSGRERLDWLMGLRRPYRRGHFVFWHGPSGTGKSWAVRALVREWRDMDTEVITDPDAFLSDPGLMNQLLLEPSEKSRRGSARRCRPGRGRLIVFEDAPELHQGELGEAARSTLAKLLNATDGLLEGDLRVVILATTHEEGAIRPSALKRPGRCLMVHPFPRLSAGDCTAWLRARERAAQRPEGRQPGRALRLPARRRRRASSGGHPRRLRRARVLNSRSADNPCPGSDGGSPSLSGPAVGCSQPLGAGRVGTRRSQPRAAGSAGPLPSARRHFLLRAAFTFFAAGPAALRAPFRPPGLPALAA